MGAIADGHRAGLAEGERHGREAERARFVGLRNDCLTTYMGGYRSEGEIEIFKHGMETVCNVVEAMLGTDLVKDYVDDQEPLP